MPIVKAEVAVEERLWSRRARLFFIIGAATACWAVPVALVYWLTG
jgi:hypothetical protein